MTSFSLYNFPITIPIQRILEKMPLNKNKQKNDNEDNSIVLEDSRMYIHLK